MWCINTVFDNYFGKAVIVSFSFLFSIDAALEEDFSHRPWTTRRRRR